jgi:hypothetical protein
VRRHPDDYGDSELELVYIARRLQEAKNVEALLTEHGLDYTVQVEQYRAGVIFVSVRAGAFFYVPVETAPRCRELLTQSGYRVQE